jgi:hypothetical protein
VLADLDEDARFPVVVEIREQMRSACILPLTSPARQTRRPGRRQPRGQCLSAGAHRISPELASLIALAVDNALHHEDAERAQRQLTRPRRLRLLLEVTTLARRSTAARSSAPSRAACGG